MAGLWSRLTAPFRRPQASAVQVRDRPWLYYQYLAHELQAGITITMDNVLTLSVVWGCVKAISDALASARWNVFLEAGDGRRELQASDSLVSVLNWRPNPDMTPMACREVLLFSALTWGNGYAEIVRTASGRVAQLWPLLPHKVYVDRDPPEKGGRLWYRYTQDGGGFIRLEADEVYHLRGPGVSGLLGDNLVARAAKSMALAAAQERFASTYYGNNTAIGGVLEIPRTLTEQAYERLKGSWEDVHKGPDKAHKVAILEGGAKFTAVTNTAVEAQAVEARTLQIEEVCRWFGVPPHKVQHLARATFSNIEHLAIEFVRDALTPWARRMEQEADYKLLSARGPARVTLIDLAPLTQGDFKSRADGYATMRNIGAMSVNDILHAEGRNGIGPDGDLRIVGVNMQTLEKLTAPTPEPAGPSGKSPEEKAQARALAVEFYVVAFERHARRMENRANDLRGKVADEQLQANLAEERDRARIRVVYECREVTALLGLHPQKVTDALESVDAGTEPRTAARTLVEV